MALEAGIRAKDRASGKLQAEQGDCGVSQHGALLHQAQRSVYVHSFQSHSQAMSEFSGETEARAFK